MRVTLSYTAEEEDVLGETAKILNLSGDDMQQAIKLFGEVQKELKNETDAEGPVNIGKCLEMVEEFRKALFHIDTRLVEVSDLVRGYEDYQRRKMSEAAAPPESLEAGE